MPWCEGCARFLNPNTLRPDGSCPSCEQKVADPPGPAMEPGQSEHASAGMEVQVPDDPPAGSDSTTEDEAPRAPWLSDDDDDVKAPWHFKLLVVLTVIYMTWRFVEMAGFLG